MRMDANGQVTIPADIRERAGLAPGVEVEVEFDGARVTLTPVDERPEPFSRGARLIAHLRSHRGDFPLSTDEIMAMTRGED